MTSSSIAKVLFQHLKFSIFKSENKAGTETQFTLFFAGWQESNRLSYINGPYNMDFSNFQNFC